MYTHTTRHAGAECLSCVRESLLVVLRLTAPLSASHNSSAHNYRCKEHTT
jgi:hypothetical protein